MTGGEIAAIITSISTLIAAIGSLWLGIINRQAITEVKHNTNSLAEKLQDSEHKRGLREGRAEGKTTEGIRK